MDGDHSIVKVCMSGVLVSSSGQANGTTHFTVGALRKVEYADYRSKVLSSDGNT